MRFEGRLKSWNAERGFGFIEPAGGGQEIFLHVSAVPTHHRPPRLGQQFSFEVSLNREGKKRASNVGVPLAAASRGASSSRRPPPTRGSAAGLLAIPAFVALYVAMAATRGVSTWFALAYGALSVVALLAYALDKSAAVAGGWRASEQSLLLLGLAGGWPGGLLAQQLLRHKSKKASFRNAFWGTVVVNVTAFVAFHAFLHAPVRA